MVTAPDIPGHRVGAILGAGGFATVYRCWQLAVGREVAVKVDNRVLLTERDRRRFLREVTAAGRLSGHPHVIDVYDAGTLDDGRPFMVMEFCPAGSLSDALRRNGPMPAAQVRDIGIRLADALAAAHAAGVLHRDIKPANILVNRYGMVGLSDFGLASIISARGDQTASREALTPAYSSPETFRGEEPTVLADIYSLAATLYALLAGRPPRFAADGRPPSFATIMTLHDKPVEDVPGTPPGLMALLRQGLSPDPAARPQSAVALRDALVNPPAVSLAPPPAMSQSPPSAVSPVSQPSHVSQSAQAGQSGYITQPGRHRQGDPSAPDAMTTGSPDPPAVTGPPPFRRRRSPRYAGLAAGLIVIIAAALLAGARLFPHGGGTGSVTGGGTSTAGTTGPTSAGGAPQKVAGVFGIATVSAGCPAAALRVATVRCPAKAECWGGLTIISGAAISESVKCSRSHYWETFAIGILPPDVQTFDQPTVAADATIRQVCSMPVLLASRQPRAQRLGARAWTIAVLPPSEAAYNSGVRTYRCLADEIAHQPTMSQFRR